MDFPLDELFVVHTIPPTLKSCLKYIDTSHGCESSRHHYIFNITDSIHCKVLETGDFSEYNSYVSVTDQKEHSQTVFQSLIDSWDLTKMKPIDIKFNTYFNKWVVYDGVHRLAILKHKKIIIDRLPFSMLNVIYDTKKVLNEKIKQIENVLLDTTKDTLYNGWNNTRAPYGYHTYSFAGKTFAGQRNNLLRIADMKKHVDFLGKSVLDFGCNTGGLLHHLPEIAKGCGTDIDEKCMIAARTLQTVFRFQKNLTFVAANLETCDLDMFSKYGPFDIIFLCSLGSWVKNWSRLYTWAITHSPIVLFEENNAIEGKPQLDFFESNGCTIKLVTANSPDDNTGNRMRNMYVVHTPLFSA